MPTHQVTNQSTPLVNYDMFTSDPVLVELIAAYEASWALQRLVSYGQFAGSLQAQELSAQANTNKPVLRTFDRFGHRIDQVEFHPAYHALMAKAIEHGIHNLPWAQPVPGAHTARAALMYMAFQNEPGHCCPISMTYSVVPALRKQPQLAERWLPLLLSDKYDPRFAPSDTKDGATFGMGMTEKQGGSDVRAVSTYAVPAAAPGPGKEYLLTGHKWFTSAPMSDAFLVLAKTDKGVCCFLVPRFKPDGTQNNFFIQRLKDKLGNHANASSEPEFEQTSGFLVGEEGRGIPTIIEMVNHTRLDCIIGATALMRQATVQALHHCRQRAAFGKKLVEQPLMRNVLADLALESEAATRLMMRVAHAYDGVTPQEQLFKRLAGAITKYWVCKRAPMHVAEALECFGGNGYVEDSPMPRLFRESPLLGIWEGSGNVICLDVLRAVSKEPESLDALVSELELARGRSKRYDRYLNSVLRDAAALKKSASSRRRDVMARRERGARRLTERLALALQASLMLRQAAQPLADAFIASRLGRQSGYAFGTLPAGADLSAILERVQSA